MVKHQTILEKFPMPSAEERVDIFLMAYQKLLAAGYCAIGMDHYALKSDDLFLASNDGRLYRNFMGYTVQRASDLIGVGASAIGEVRSGFFQNANSRMKIAGGSGLFNR
jgi:oxygen-independent coproporphyrinogen III oxidase